MTPASHDSLLTASMFEEDNFCFACGRENPFGLNLAFSCSGDRAYAEFRITKNHQGYRDIVHGGIIAAILDEAMIKAASSKEGNAITAALSVRFKNPLMVGESASVEAVIKKSGRRLIEAYARIKGQDSRTVAEANGKLLTVGSDQGR